MSEGGSSLVSRMGRMQDSSRMASRVSRSFFSGQSEAVLTVTLSDVELLQGINKVRDDFSQVYKKHSHIADQIL